VTAGANDSDGSVVSVLAALSHDVEYLVIGASAFTVGGGDSSVLLDIVIDPAGGTNWIEFINDLLVGWSSAYSQLIPVARWFNFPIFIPAGASVGVRARAAHSSTVTGEVIIHAYGGNANPASWWCGQGVESIGINAAASSGTSISSGASGSFGSWADLGSPLSRDCGALQFMAQGQPGVTASVNVAFIYELGVGDTRIGSPIQGTNNTAESGLATLSGLIFKNIGSGTQLRARGANSSAGAIDFDCAAYAVY
jgi:hypothetical protein